MYEFFLPGLYDFTVKIRRKEGAILARKVVTYHYDVDNVTEYGHEAGIHVAKDLARQSPPAVHGQVLLVTIRVAREPENAGASLAAPVTRNTLLRHLEIRQVEALDLDDTLGQEYRVVRVNVGTAGAGAFRKRKLLTYPGVPLRAW